MGLGILYKFYSKIVTRAYVRKTITNQTYTVISPAELGNLIAFILDVSIVRSQGYNYSYVTGWGGDSSSNLWVYFAVSINATLDIMVHYVVI